MALTFNPYPLEPWIRKQENEQRPDLNQTVVQPLLQGLQLWQQNKEAQRKAELEKQILADKNRQWNVETFGFDPSQSGTGMTQQPMGTGLFTQQEYSSDAPTMLRMSGRQPMDMADRLKLWRTDRNRPNFINTSQQTQSPTYGMPTLTMRKQLFEESKKPKVEEKDYLSIGQAAYALDPDNQSRVLSELTPLFPDGKVPLSYINSVANRELKKSMQEQQAKEAEAKRTSGNEKLQSTLELYEAARSGLIGALDESATGPIVGRIPAFTAKQQVAEGGVAAMAPVLKQLFRVAGEGVFTDRDQALLLAMIPTRAVRPEARKAMMDNIDSIVKAKLGMANKNMSPEDSGNTPSTPEIGEEQDGYIYVGGNPSNPNSWRSR